MQHSKTQQLEFTLETKQYIQSFSQSVKDLKELLHQKVYLDLNRNDIDRVINRLEILEEREEDELIKRCVWCKAIQDIHTRQWENGPAEILQNTQDVICPDCIEKFQAISERRQINE